MVDTHISVTKRRARKQYGQMAYLTRDLGRISVCHGREGMALSMVCELVCVVC